MSYTQEQVIQGRKLATKDAMNRLALGDLILEVAPMGEHGGERTESKSTAVLLKFADEIGIAVEQAEQYRKVSAKIPHDLREAALANKVTITYGIWRFAAFGEGRLEKLAQLIEERPGGRVLKDEFMMLFENTKGETYSPAHRQSQSVEKQLADPVAREMLIEQVADDEEAVAEVLKKVSEKIAAPSQPKQGSTEVATAGPNWPFYASQKINAIENYLQHLYSVPVEMLSVEDRKMHAADLQNISEVALSLKKIFTPVDFDAELSKMLDGNK